jgi:hypothetical protein
MASPTKKQRRYGSVESAAQIPDVSTNEASLGPSRLWLGWSVLFGSCRCCVAVRRRPPGRGLAGRFGCDQACHLWLQQ